MSISANDSVYVYRTLDRDARCISLNVEARYKQPLASTKVLFSGVVACRFNVDGVYGYERLDIRECDPNGLIPSLFRYPDMLEFGRVDFWTGSEDELRAYVHEHPLRGFRLMEASAELSSDALILAEDISRS